MITISEIIAEGNLDKIHFDKNWNCSFINIINNNW